VADADAAILAELAAAVAERRPVALATVVETHRSAPRRAGAKMLVYGSDRRVGTVGGGDMEARVVTEAHRSLQDGKPRLLRYELLDAVRGDPGVCGGEVTIYVEPHMPAHTVYVVGCGHVGRAVVDLAHWLGYRTVASDDRTELVTAEALPGADVLLPGSIADALEAEPIDPDTSVVVVTRSSDVDAEILPPLLATPARYIGVMGSRRRWEVTRRALAAAGAGPDDLDRVHCPIGVEVGAETLEEIAVSILAEVIANNRTPGIDLDAPEPGPG
jgi:xanthine dehydrogenase accessory factor